MKYLQLSILFLCLIGTLNSCDPGIEFSEIPEITDVRIDKTSIENFNEFLLLSIDFQDGDGDIGISDDSPNGNVLVIDSRTGVPDTIKIPWNLEAPGNVKAISGTLEIQLVSVCCIDPQTGITCTFDGDYEPTNELRYTVMLEDRAGNLSNAFNTPLLEVVCPQ